jgi:uncharacterized protein (TIGR02145 family)
MVLKYFLFGSAFLFASCTLVNGETPSDYNNKPHRRGGSPSSSSSVVLSSSSVVVYSSSAVVLSSSSTPPSSSSVASSSSRASSSSAIVPSSSSGSIQTGVIYDTPVTYEGETYQTVVIGTQIWMARNLNYAVSGSKCYNNDPANCATYGRLYNWATAMALPSNCNSNNTCSSQVGTKHKGVCPSGWHIPSDAEWTKLTDFVGGSSTAGTKLKSRSGWNSNGNGEDKYGFNALPGGSGSGSWWSATEYDAFLAWNRYIYYDAAGVVRYSDSKTNPLSVRCVKD